MENKAIAVKDNTVYDQVLAKVNSYRANGELALPRDYSPGNAIKSAQLKISEVVDRNKRPALEVCSRASVAQALLDTLLQGLNPGKNQCYYIVYGDKLVMQRSYFGEIHVAKLCDPDVKDIYADVVYKGDTFEYSKHRGCTVVDCHKQSLDNVNGGDIIAAYCTVIYRDGHEETTIMTISEIYASWRMSRQSPFDDNGRIKASSTHGRFPAEMAKKTVVRKACKKIINSSDDSQLLLQSIRATDDAVSDIETDNIIDVESNSAEIDIEPPECDRDTGEVIEPDAASEDAPY